MQLLCNPVPDPNPNPNPNWVPIDLNRIQLRKFLGFRDVVQYLQLSRNMFASTILWPALMTCQRKVYLFLREVRGSGEMPHHRLGLLCVCVVCVCLGVCV